MAKVRIVIDDAAVLQRVGDEVERRVTASVLIIESIAIRLVSRGQPVRRLSSGRLVGLDPSKPGEPPKVVTGHLRKTITHRVRRLSTRILGEVGSNAKHARPLELGTNRMAARPFLRPALATAWPLIRALWQTPTR